MSSREVDPIEVQTALADALRAYADHRIAGERFAPFADGDVVTATQVVVACSEMLKAVDVEIFELAMWEVYGA